ncbi:hypothetical protein DFH09DRAFT_1144043 [Mycena vulgaris]|nr:hypothetical protein DFH09DRAFT_1144043 [Mycena vulgaris]
MFLANSPFADKLETNYVPSDTELAHLRALLVEPLDELARVDAQLEEMDVLIRELKTKRAALEVEIDAHKALMAPLRRIPNDVLGEIFVACLPTAHNALIDPGEAPLILGRICKHWRSVAYSTPTLWSSLHIPPLTQEWVWPHVPKVPVARSVERKLEEVVAAWLDRAAACPLSIFFSRFPNHLLESPDAVDRVIGASRRIRNLHIWGTCIGPVRPLLLLRGEDLPCLESIAIKCGPDADHPLPFWDGVAVFDAPNLRRISFNAHADALKLPLPWVQLTELNLECSIEYHPPNQGQGGLDLNGAQEVLRRCPNLVRCCLHITNSNSFTPGPIITLPHLTTLTLYQSFPSVQLLGCLILPNLRYLGVGGNDPRFIGVGGDEASPSSRDVEGSAHELTLEIMYGTYLSDDGLLDLLHLLPGISRIQAPGFHARELLLDILRPTPQGTICPALTHLELGNCDFFDIALLEFIRARRAMATPLRGVEAHFSQPMVVDIMQELQSYMKEGLRVDLRYPSPVPWRLNPREGIYDVPWDE